MKQKQPGPHLRTLSERTKRTKRTDAHRPSAIVPSEYEYELSYDHGSESEPAWNMEPVRALCEAIGWGKKSPMFGHVGKCGICGAWFRYGDVWVHRPTGDLIHVGHDCAEKYQLLADRPDFVAYLETLKKGRAAAAERKLRDLRLEGFLRIEPSLRSVFEIEHPTIQDMVLRVRQFGQLTPKQVELACSIASKAWCPERPEEAKVPAPMGRKIIEGVIVGKKTSESAWGLTTRMTVKVTTEQGVWLCNGSTLSGVQVGEHVRFRATLEPGKDAHFAFFKRPHDLRDSCSTCTKKTLRKRFCSDDCAVEWDAREQAGTVSAV